MCYSKDEAKGVALLISMYPWQWPAEASNAANRQEALSDSYASYLAEEVIWVTSLIEYLARNGVASLAAPQNDRRP